MSIYQKKPIKIAFDMFVLGQGIKTGVYRVCDELYKRFSKITSIQPYAILRDNQYKKEAIYYLKKNNLNWEWLHPDQIERCDALFLPFLGPWEPWTSDSSILKIFISYDLIPLLYPDFFEININKLINKIYQEITPDTLILCISKNTKKDLHSYRIDIPNENCVVIPLAAGDMFYKYSDNKSIRKILNLYKIPEKSPYFLSLATLEIRKNMHHIVHSFLEFKKLYPNLDVNLVLTGMKGWKIENLEQQLKKLGEDKNHIILTGYVNDEHLAALYSGASAFIYMSRYEGFGLPPLEAMSCGTPVIASNTSSLPEVIGNAGIMLNPDDIQGLCTSMHSILSNQKLHNDLSQKSIIRSKLFNWDTTTKLIIDEISKKISTYPKLTIITICYNEKYIEDTCRSILEQTWTNFEWIVVDGGSTDNTLHILDKYKHIISYMISEQDNGRYHAMNKGIKKARGKYVLFLNGGDYLASKDTLKNIFEYKPIPKLEKYTSLQFDADIMYGEVIAKETGMMPWPIWSVGEQKFDMNYFANHSLPHQATFIKRSMFSKCGFYDENLKFSGDYEWFMRAILLHKATTCYIPSQISIYNFEGISSQNPDIESQQLMETRLVFNKYLKIVSNNHNTYQTFSRHIKKCIFWVKCILKYLSK